jgi:oxygen-independent coproporphyrinogen-3 oxidase
MLKLRLREGLSFTECERFGINRAAILRKANRIPKHLLNITDQGIALSPEGWLVSNAVIARLLLF